MTALRRIALSLALSCLLPPLLAAGRALADVRYGPQPFPTGSVGYARPPIGLLVFTTDGDTVASGTLELDGVPHRLLREDNLVVYYPDRPLAPGTHSARLRVTLAGGRWLPIDVSWQFTVVPGALADLPPPDGPSLAAAAEVNRWRREADLRPLRLDRSLDAAAEAHARYLLAHPAEGLGAHNEAPGETGFTGVEPQERGAFFGYPWWSYGEDIHFITDHRQAVRDWVDSVYHRLPILSPSAQDVGYGFAADRRGAVNVLEVGATGPLTPGDNPGEPLAMQEAGPVIVYPAPGQRDVPTHWDGNEVPDPYRLFPGVGPAGYPVTVQFDRGQVQSTVVDAASLVDDAGQPVPLNVLSSANDDHIGPNVALLPTTDLQPGRRYTATVRGRARLQDGRVIPFARTWWFTTAGAPDQILLQTDVRVLLDGVPVVSEAPPALRNNRTMLPLRAVAEALGATVGWDPDRYDVTVVRGNRRLFLKIENDRALVDGREVLLDAPPFIANDRTLVPVRFLAESLGLRVRWDEATRTVLLFSSQG